MKKSIKFFCIFLICLFLLLLVFRVTYSKYLTKIEVTTKTNIAKPLIYIEKTDYKNIATLGDEKIYYEFSVKNFNENITDVSFKYKLFFEYSQENPPIIINLYKADTGEKIELLRK